MNEPRPHDLQALPEVTFLEFLGEGQAEAWRGCLKGSEDLETDVVIKIYRFEEAGEWKGLELFQREIDVLQQLKHPGIPRYLFHREVDAEGFLHVYLVQEFMPGQPLSKHRAASADLQIVAKGVLEILTYLQSFSPPVIHRDIKPSNIIFDGQQVWLIDFGAVQVITPADEGGSTIVGTSGYMPFEQLTGRAVPASDLYGLGMTLVWMVTGRPPDTLPVSKMKVIWQNQVTMEVPERIRELIDQLIEPTIEDRIQEATRALELLETGPETRLIRRPANMVMTVTQTPQMLKISVPNKVDSDLIMTPLVVIACFIGVYWNAEFLFWGFLVSGFFIFDVVRKNLTTPREFIFLPGSWSARARGRLLGHGKTSEILGVSMDGRKEHEGALELVTRERTFTTRFKVSRAEADWISATVDAFIRSSS